MTWPVLGPRDRRALRLAAWTVVPLLLVGLVIRPYWRAMRASSEELATQRTLLARELGAVRDAANEAELVRRGRRALAEEHSRLFDGGDAVAASAALASYVAERAAESGVDVEESETRAVPDSTAVAAVEIGASGSVLDVVQFLRALEEGPRLARADRVVISPAGGTLRSGIVTLKMTVTGLSRRAYDDSAQDSLEGSR